MFGVLSGDLVGCHMLDISDCKIPTPGSWDEVQEDVSLDFDWARAERTII